MDKQKVLREIDIAIKNQDEEIRNIEFKIDETRHQAEVRASYLEGQKRATRDFMLILHEIKAGLEAIE